MEVVSCLMCVLGFEFDSSRTALHALNRWNITPAPDLCKSLGDQLHDSLYRLKKYIIKTWKSAGLELGRELGWQSVEAWWPESSWICVQGEKWLRMFVRLPLGRQTGWLLRLITNRTSLLGEPLVEILGWKKVDVSNKEWPVRWSDLHLWIYTWTYTHTHIHGGIQEAIKSRENTGLIILLLLRPNINSALPWCRIPIWPLKLSLLTSS